MNNTSNLILPNIVDDDDDDDDNAVDVLTDIQLNPSAFLSSKNSMKWGSSKKIRRFDGVGLDQGDNTVETKDEQNRTLLSMYGSNGSSSNSSSVADGMSVKQPVDRLYLDTIDDDGENGNDALPIDTYLVCGEKAQCKEGVDVYDVAVNPAVMATLDWDGSGISFIKVQ
jgi:hypothetical protein